MFDATGVNPYAVTTPPKGTETWAEYCDKLMAFQSAIYYVDLIHAGLPDEGAAVRERSIITGKWSGWYMFKDDRFSPSMGNPQIVSDKIRFFVGEKDTSDAIWTLITQHHFLLYRAFNHG